jgi:hypothetical protein
VIVTIKGAARKRCPYRDERDEGTVELTFDLPSGDAPELHKLSSDLLSGSEDWEVSHEEYTRSLFNAYTEDGCIRAVTTWHTAGLEVSCAVPDGGE